MRRLLAAVACALAIGSLVLDAQTVRFVDGLFLYTSNKSEQPIELKAWAELTGRGQLRMSRGSLSDAPVVTTISHLRCSIPMWIPVGAFIATDALFVEERSERRNMSLAARKLNVYALELRIADLERRTKIDSMLEAVNASQDSPGYAFVVLSGGDYQRFYPIRLTPVDR